MPVFDCRPMRMIRDLKSLREAIFVAQDLAKHGHLVTFDIVPKGPETGYGYIQRGTALKDGNRAFAVTRFVEKPDSQTADRYVKAGDHYWNSGIFAFQARTFLSEMQRLEPDIMARCQRAIISGKQDGEYFSLDRDSFEACKSISIDYAIMERTDRAAIVPVEMGWSDIGSWEALWDVSEKDAGGNVVTGDVLHLDVRGSYLRSEGPLIAALGVRDLVVVASPDAVLVSPKSAAQHIKSIVARLDQDGRDLHVSHRKVHHPWGSCERIDQGENFQVNRITLNPGAALQLHPRDRLTSSRWVRRFQHRPRPPQSRKLLAPGKRTLCPGEFRSPDRGMPEVRIFHIIEIRTGGRSSEHDRFASHAPVERHRWTSVANTASDAAETAS